MQVHLDGKRFDGGLFCSFLLENKSRIGRVHLKIDSTQVGDINMQFTPYDSTSPAQNPHCNLKYHFLYDSEAFKNRA